MNILILNAPVENPIVESPDQLGEGFIEVDDFGYFPPLGALYVLSYLEKHSVGHNLFFKDCVAEKISHKGLEGVIRQINPDIVGITSFTLSLYDIIISAQTIKKIVPNAHICLGGHHPTAFPYEAAQLKEFDSIVVGEGETAFCELVKAISQNLDITNIRGVYTCESIKRFKGEEYKDNRFINNVIVQPAYIEDIDTIPIPNRSYIQHINYQSILGVTDKLATIISSRGCPYRCTFCDVPYKQYRKRSAKLVVDEIEVCLSMGYKEFHFYDDLFNITPSRVIEICAEIERRGLKFPWDFRGRVNTATFESLEMAKKMGCRMISFGVETGTNAGLKALQKRTTVEKIREVFNWCKKLGIKTVADYMIGLPFEKTKEDVLASIDFLIEIDPDYANINVLNLYPHTTLFEEAAKKGLIQPQRWDEFALKPSRNFKIDHWEEFFTPDELASLRKTAYLRFYLRFAYILKSVLSTRSFYEFKTKVKGAIKLVI